METINAEVVSTVILCFLIFEVQLCLVFSVLAWLNSRPQDYSHLLEESQPSQDAKAVMDAIAKSNGEEVKSYDEVAGMFDTLQ